MKKGPRFQFEGLSRNGNPQCRAHGKTTGKRCKIGSVRGRRVCWKHGGRSRMKSGLYAKYLKGRLHECITAIEVERPKLDSELKLLRALLAQTSQFLNLIQEANAIEQLPLLSTMIDMVKDLVSEIRSCEEAIARITDRNSITPEQVTIVVSSLVKLLSKHVDQPKMKLISRDFDKISWPAGITTFVQEDRRALLGGNGNGR